MSSIKSLVAICALAGGAIGAVITFSTHASVTQLPPEPGVLTVNTPAPRPQSFTVNGWTYQCSDVRQAVAAGEDFTPDGHRIYSILLMDCNI